MASNFEIVVANRQRKRRLNPKFIREIATAIFEETRVENAELGLHFVSAKEMAKVHRDL